MPFIFSTLFQTQGNVFALPKQRVSKIKNPATLGKIRILCRTFSKYFRPLHKLVQAADALQRTTTDRIPELPTDRLLIFSIKIPKVTSKQVCTKVSYFCLNYIFQELRLNLDLLINRLNKLRGFIYLRNANREVQRVVGQMFSTLYKF